MNKIQKRGCKKSGVNKLLILLLFLFGIEVFYIINSRTTISREYELLDNLKSLKILNQKIDGLFNKNIDHQSFDAIAEDTREFKTVLLMLKEHAFFDKEKGHKSFHGLYNKLHSDFELSEGYIERYKSWNGLTINSTRVLFDMHGYIKKLIRKRGTSEKEHFSEELLDEIIFMVALINFDRLSESETLMKKVELFKREFQNDKRLLKSVNIMYKHIHVLLEGQALMQVLKQEHSDLLIGDTIDKMYKLLLDDFVSKDRDNLFNFYLMNAVVLFLLIILFFISNKESQLHEKVCLLNNDLEDKLIELEDVNGEMKKLIEKFDRHVIASETDEKGIITYASTAFCEVSGYSLEELLGQPHNIVRHSDVSKDIYKEMWSTIKSGKEWTGEIKNRKKDGSDYWVEVFVSPELDKNGNITGYSAIRHLISSKKDLEELSHSLEQQVYERTHDLEVMMEKVKKLSITDELTGLYNRRYYAQIIDNEIKRAERNKVCFGYFILDIDNFKRFNDNYGHQRGDQVLMQVANRFTSVLERPDDFVFRMGGEEFLIIFTGETKTKVVDFAQKVIESIAMLNIEHAYNDGYHVVTVSGGLVVHEPEDESMSADEMYKLSDELLYAAKEAGRNCLKS